MIKNQLDYKILNITFIALIVYLIFQTGDFWIMAVSTILKCLRPFLIAFAIAYVLDNFVNKFAFYKFPRKFICIGLLIFTFSIFVLFFYLLFPILFNQLGDVFEAIITFLQDLSLNRNVDFSAILDKMTLVFNNTLESFGTYISNGAFNLIGASLDLISQVFVILAAMVYFFLDFDKLRNYLKKYLISNSLKKYYYFKAIDDELSCYVWGFIKIVVISFFEYGFVYFIIGHPNFIILALLAALMNFIPYFGGIITNLMAVVTAFVVSFNLFVKALIVMGVFSIIDGYIINPLVFRKSNRLHPLIIIIAVFVGSYLLGFLGALISVPLVIILMTTLKFLKFNNN